MSLKVTLIVILLISLLSSPSSGRQEVSLAEEIIDKVTSNMMAYADPDNMITENMDELKNLCNKLGSNFADNVKGYVSRAFSGIVIGVVEHLIRSFNPNNHALCKLLMDGEVDKALTATKEFNLHANQGNPTRLGMITIMHKLGTEDSKMKIPELTCIMKKFGERITASYPDKNGAKNVIKGIFDVLLYPIINGLEEQRGPASATCELPDANSNPTKFVSILIPTFKAIQKLENN